MAEMGPDPDHQRLAAEVLGIRNAPPDLARRLVSQALVVEDRREAWRRTGERICAGAPRAPGSTSCATRSAGRCTSERPINLRRRLRDALCGAPLAGHQGPARARRECGMGGARVGTGSAAEEAELIQSSNRV